MPNVWIDDATAPDSAWDSIVNPIKPGSGTEEVREFEADFETPDHSVDSASTSRRPDAISLDYRTALSIGPLALGMPGAAYVRVWRARATDNAVYLARTNDAGDGYDAEALLFNYAGAPIDEIDIAFDQQSNVVICAERAGHVWIYYFSSLTSAYGFEDFGAGRSPRALLDDPYDVANNDVLVFYVDDIGDRIAMRAQRDRYAIAYGITGSGAGHVYLEDAYKATDGRVHVLYSMRDPVSGTYALHTRESLLYPQFCDIGQFTTLLDVETGEVLKLLYIVEPSGYIDPEGLTPDALLELGQFQASSVVPQASSTLLNVGPIDKVLYDIDQFQAAAVVPQALGSSLALPIIGYVAYDIDSFKAASTVPLAAGSALIAIVITKTLFDIDSFKAASVVPQATGSSLV